MGKLEDSKRIYDAIRPSGDLPAVLRNSLRLAHQKKQARRRWRPVRYAACFLIFLCVAFTITLNAVPALGQGMYDVPVLGQMARVFTFWRFEEASESSYIHIKMPAIDNTGNTKLEKRLNQEIRRKISQVLDEAKARAKEYYQAYLDTGGQKEAYIPMEIGIDYEIKCNNGQTLSFAVYEYETQATYSSDYTFYNIDLESGRDLTLHDLLGEGYIEKANAAVKQGIARDEASDPNLQYYHDESAFQTIQPDQPFYINADGYVVLVFEKYELGPGYMGMREFVVPA